MRWYQKLWSRLRALKLVANRVGGLTARGAAGMAVAFLVAALTMPIGLDAIYSANTTGWDAAVITIFTILFPILFVVAMALKAFGKT